MCVTSVPASNAYIPSPFTRHSRLYCRYDNGLWKQKRTYKVKELIERQEKELSTTELQNLAMCAMNSARSYWNEDFAEAAGVAKPISTGPGGSEYVREYRGKIADLRRKQAAPKEQCCKKPGFTNLAKRISETWIAKLDEI
jgi:hypothetical protein